MEDGMAEADFPWVMTWIIFGCCSESCPDADSDCNGRASRGRALIILSCIISVPPGTALTPKTSSAPSSSRLGLRVIREPQLRKEPWQSWCWCRCAPSCYARWLRLHQAACGRAGAVPRSVVSDVKPDQKDLSPTEGNHNRGMGAGALPVCPEQAVVWRMLHFLALDPALSRCRNSKKP